MIETIPYSVALFSFLGVVNWRSWVWSGLFWYFGLLLWCVFGWGKLFCVLLRCLCLCFFVRGFMLRVCHAFWAFAFFWVLVFACFYVLLVVLSILYRVAWVIKCAL